MLHSYPPHLAYWVIIIDKHNEYYTTPYNEHRTVPDKHFINSLPYCFRMH